MPHSLYYDAFAKINWDLRILGKRPDGFHELDSIFVTVDLSDKMTFNSAGALSLECSNPTLPVDGSNLVMKAAVALAQAAGINRGARICLTKMIPMGGGLGGGSSDAACALVALNRLWDLNWSVEKLASIASQIGSDVAYFLYGGWCLCRGRGEIVERLPDSEKWSEVNLLLILPPLHVATPAVYKALSYPQWNGKGGRSAMEAHVHFSGALEMRNDLMSAARQVEPRLKLIQSVLENYFPGRWLMSGSGASHFALLSDEEEDYRIFTDEIYQAVPGTEIVETVTRSNPASLDPNP